MGHNVSLAIAPHAGLVIEVDGCSGRYAYEASDVEIAGEKIELVLRDRAFPAGARETPRDLVPVRWGERHYLIPSACMQWFCSDVHSGSEPRPRLRGAHFLREGDESKRAAGLPEIPERFLSSMREPPVEGRILGILARPDESVGYTRAVLDVGTSDGITVGRILRLRRPGTWRTLEVERVSARKCTVLVVPYGARRTEPAVGQVYTTWVFDPALDEPSRSDGAERRSSALPRR